MTRWCTAIWWKVKFYDTTLFFVMLCVCVAFCIIPSGNYTTTSCKFGKKLEKKANNEHSVYILFCRNAIYLGQQSPLSSFASVLTGEYKENCLIISQPCVMQLFWCGKYFCSSAKIPVTVHPWSLSINYLQYLCAFTTLGLILCSSTGKAFLT